MQIIDFHVHSSVSKDSNISPKIIPKIMRNLSYNAVCIADHNSNKGGLIASKYAPKNFIVLIGQEIKTPQGEIIVVGSEKKLFGNIWEIIDIAEEENLLTILPHPFDFIRKNSACRKLNKKDLIKLFKKVHAIEAFNSRCIFNIHNSLAKFYAKMFRKSLVAGSDAHTLSELGNAKTFVEAELSKDSIFEAVRKGKTKIFGKKSCFIMHMKSFYISCKTFLQEKKKLME
ncbi:MAG TPA: hypothetical protein EYH56_03215 [Nanoarchaeota archaeon]|nr:hypothetical protein [Nanoarchaeota archaeon]